jgi:hypothetical protein
MTDTELLEQIVNRLDRIEEILANGDYNNNNNNFQPSNKTLEIKETRQLMQDIVKYYMETEPSINIEIGTRLQIFRFRDTIAKVKNIHNPKFEHRRLLKWIRKLEEYEFVTRLNANMFEVLDTGKSWWDNQE